MKSINQLLDLVKTVAVVMLPSPNSLTAPTEI